MTKVVSQRRKGKLSADDALFVTRQSGSKNWYFRYTIPPELRDLIGRSSFWETTKTPVKSDAAALVNNLLLPNAKSAIALARAYQKTRNHPRGRVFVYADKPLTDFKQDELLWLSNAFVDINHLSMFRAESQRHDEPLLRLAIADAMSDDFEMIEFFMRVMARNFIFMTPKSPIWDKAYCRYLEIKKEQLKLSSVVHNTKKQEKLSKMSFEDFTKNLFTSNDLPDEKPFLLISQITKEYIKSHDNFSRDKDELTRFKNCVQCFTDFVGDLPINYVRKKQVQEFMTELAKFPAYRTNAMSDMKFQEVIRFCEEVKPDYLTITRHTAGVWFSRLSNLFQYAVDTYEDQSNLKNPFTGMNKSIKGRDSITKRPFTKAEVAELFSKPLFTAIGAATSNRDARFWIPVLAVHHGGRLSEFANRKIEDVKCEDGIWYVDVTKAKNKKSIRAIPLHKFVLELGFLDYVADLKARGQEWLFPFVKNKPNAKEFSKWFGRWQRENCVHSAETTLYCLRHTWVTNATRLGVEKVYRTAMTGHKASDIHEDVYTKLNLKDLKSELDKVAIDGFPYEAFRTLYSKNAAKQAQSRASKLAT